MYNRQDMGSLSGIQLVASFIFLVPCPGQLEDSSQQDIFLSIWSLKASLHDLSAGYWDLLQGISVLQEIKVEAASTFIGEAQNWLSIISTIFHQQEEGLASPDSSIDEIYTNTW